MDQMQGVVNTCGNESGSGHDKSAPAGAGGAGGASGAGGAAQAGGGEPEIAMATHAACRGPVALYWHGMPSPAAAATGLALAGALGPVLLQRVIVAEEAVAADASWRLPRALAPADAEVVVCLGADRLRVLAAAWQHLVVDDLARHPVLATVVLAGAPDAVAARVAPMVRWARRRCMSLSPTSAAALLAAPGAGQTVPSP